MFDPVQKTLLADQGEIRVGCKYQAEIPDRLAEGTGGYWESTGQVGGHYWGGNIHPDPPSQGESDNRNQQKMEMKVWDPDNPLTDRQIDQFLVVAR